MHNLYSSIRGTSFKPSLKAVDPKILRQVDAAAARNTVAASLVSLVVFDVVVFSSGLYLAVENLVMSYCVVMISVAVIMLLVSLRFRDIYCNGPTRWYHTISNG